MTKPLNRWKGYDSSWSKPVIEAFMHLDNADAPDGNAKYDGKFMGVDLFEMADSYVKKFRNKRSAQKQGIVWVLNSAEALGRYSSTLNKSAQGMAVPIACGLLEGASAIIENRTPNFDRYVKPELGLLPERMNFLMELIFKKQLILHENYWRDFWETNLEGCHAPIFDTQINCPF